MNKNFHVDLDTLVNIISSIPANIFYKDKDLKYVFSSHIWEQIEDGKDENFDIYGKKDSEVRKDKANAKNAEKADKEIIKKGEGKRYTIKSEVDGNIKYLDISKEPVRDSEGNVVGIVGLINDVSEVSAEIKQQYEDIIEEAERVSRMKSDFLANTSHEIRTPLNAILGMTDLILREYDDEKLIDYATNIKNSSNVLLALINDLLDFSKIEEGKMEIIPANYMFESFVGEIISTNKLKAYKKFLSFNSDIDLNIPCELFGDDKRITQVIMNLLSNAIKYTDKGGVTFKVSLVEKNEDTCKIKYEIVDTGVGIKEEDIKKLSNSFTRLENQRNKTVEGTGLGIAISDRLLQQMKSKLDIQSVYGEGSTFSFVLEQKIVDKTSYGEYIRSKRDVEENNQSFTAPNANILIVDDVFINLKVAEGLLEKLEMNIDTALSGQEAIDKCKTKKYDMIFMDHMMPEMNGAEAMKHIREEIDGYDNVPIIALTANAVSDAKQESFELGYSDFATKPIVLSYITGLIKKWLPKDLIEYMSYDEEDEKKEDDNANEITSIEIPNTKANDALSFDNTLKVFYESIDISIALYRQLLTDGNLNAFRDKMLEVNGIALAIAAENLAEKSLELAELSNDENNIEEIKNKYNDFEKYFIGFKEKLSVILSKKGLI